MAYDFPWSVTPTRCCTPSPSSARITPPCGETVMLSGPSKFVPSWSGVGLTVKIVVSVIRSLPGS
jgi:hypothetical protein